MAPPPHAKKRLLFSSPERDEIEVDESFEEVPQSQVPKEVSYKAQVVVDNSESTVTEVLVEVMDQDSKTCKGESGDPNCKCLELKIPLLQRSHFLHTSADHCFEHYGRLGDVGDPRRDQPGLLFREEHWEQCIFGGAYKSLARHCYLGEQEDLLTTVHLSHADKAPATDKTFDDLKIERGEYERGQPDRTELEVKEKEDKDYKRFVWGSGDDEWMSASKNNLFFPYKMIPGYVDEAVARLRAVFLVNEHLSAQKKYELHTQNPAVRLIHQELKRVFDKDPRARLAKELALYHWQMKTDLTDLEKLPLI